MSITGSLTSPSGGAPPSGAITSALAGIPGGQGLAQAEQGLIAEQPEKKKLYEQGAADIGEERKKLDALTPPTLEKLPDAPEEPKADPLKAFGTPAVWLAVLGGMLTRRSLTTSLNAAAGAMGALRQQDMDTYKQKYDEWKVSTENAMRLQNFKNQAYEEAVSKITTDANLARVQLETAGHAFGDETMVHLAQTNMDEALRYKEAQVRMSESLERSSTALQEKHAEVTLLSDLTAARKGLAAAQKAGDPAQIAEQQQKVADAHQAIMDHAEVKYPGVVTAEMRASVANYDKPVAIDVTDADGKKRQVLAQQNKSSGQWVSADENRTPIDGTITKAPNQPVDDTSVTSLAQRIASYRERPMSGWSLATPFGQAVSNEVTKINPAYDETQWEGKHRAVVSFDTGRQGDKTRSLNVSIQHLHLLDQLSTALANNDIQTVNSIKNTISEEFGGADVTNFDVAKGIVGDEIVNSTVASSGGALADRQNAQNQLSRAKSWEQLAGATQTARRLMAGQLGGLKRQYQQATGLNDFESKLDPETIGELERGGGGAGTAGGQDFSHLWK